ncbi:alpha-amylase [Paenibacillus sp. FSL K6-2524]|uniref:alpha-amylase n=1 Tax=Paenibacillus sp. FSL K6-2524 TaxID=2954516 RepID=UPI0030FA41B3
MVKKRYKFLVSMMLLFSMLWGIAVSPAVPLVTATEAVVMDSAIEVEVLPAIEVAEAPATLAAADSTPVNGTIMQFFEWNSAKDGGHWNELAAQAKNLSDVGITAIWIPPAYKGHVGIDDVGYGVYDFYDLGEFNQKGTVRTKYGTKAELKTAVNALHSNNVQVYADIVVNHMMGADQTENIKVTQVEGNNRNNTISEFNTNVSTKYNFSGRNNTYSGFKWDWTHFDGSDDYGKIYRYPGKSWDWEVSSENGNYDYLMGTDLDYDNQYVADEIKKWGVWYVNEIGLDGYRLDAVKHIKYSFMQEFLENARAKTGKELFSVGEFIGSVNDLQYYLSKVSQSMSLFDFPMRNNFAQASSSNGNFDLRNLSSGTLTAVNSTKSVTFVENHDTQPDRGTDAHGAPVLDWFKPLAYAYTLTREAGYPTVFYGDYYGTRSSSTAAPGTGKIKSLKSKIDPLLIARKDYAYGKQNDYLDNTDLIGWTREGLASKPNSGLATVMSDRTGGSKTMYVGTSHAGEQWKDITGNFTDKVTIGSNGNGTFKVKDGSVSVWVRDAVTVDQVPTVPTNVQGTAVGTTSINLTWNASTDDKGVVKYEIYRDGVLIGETTTTSYTDTTVSANKTYSYTIKAVDTIGQKSAATTAISVTTGSGTQDQIPTAPANVQGTAVGTSSVSLTWSPSTDDKGVVKYEIYRDSTLRGESVSTSYADSNIANDKTYIYTVRAVDTIGQRSSFSSPVSVKIGNGGQQEVVSSFSWDNVNMYFVMTDRFNNGNTSNDGAYGRPKTDAWGSNVGTFHGGDIKGLTKKLEEGYFTDLGTNAIWLTAPWEQMHGWVGGKDGDFAHYGYHGYYGLDFTEMDKSIGTIDEMREFVDLAHTKGIRVVFDVVMNHVAYPNLVDMAEYGYGDRGGLAGNWTPNKDQGQTWHTHNNIMNTTNTSAWATWWGSSWIRASNISGYDQGGGDELTSLVGFLPDIKTESTSGTSLPPVLKTKFGKETSGYDNWIVPAAKQYRKDLNIAPKDYMIKWLSSWVEEFGIDGFRIDTAKHVQADRWKDLKTSANSALTKWRQSNPTKPGANWTDSFWMTGEVFDQGLGRDTRYFDTGGFDSLINFSFKGSNMNDLEGTFSRYASEFNNDLPNYNMLSYISSHDKGLYSRDNLIQAGTALLLLPGGVQTFYGDESGRPFGATGSDPDQGARSDMNWNNMNQTILSHWQKIGQFRNNHIAVGAGTHKKIADSPYTFSRTYEQGDILDKVVVATGTSGTVDINVSSMFPDGTTVRDAYTKSEVVVSNGKAKFTAGANGVILIENVGANKKFPVLTASPAGGKFKTATTTITLSVKNADSGKYTLDGSDPINGIAFTNGTTITIGADMAIDDTKTLKLYGTNENGEGTASYTFTKGDPNAKLQIFFKKPAAWGTPSLYFYDTAPKDNDPTWATAPAMQSDGGDWYVYTFATAEKATFIFKDSTGKQMPAQNQPGFTRAATGWYDGSVWHDTDPRVLTKPTTPSNVTASVKTDKTVTLTWTASTDVTGITGYDVYRNNVKVGSPTTTTYKDTGLTAETTYTYKVIARSQSGGTSDPSGDLTVTTEKTGPIPDNVVTIYYKKGYATPYIHYRIEGGTWTAVPGVKMEESAIPGYAVYTIDLGTSTATRVEAAFNNGSGQWDSNNQKNYFFNKGDNIYSAGTVTAGKPAIPGPGNKVTVYYKEGWSNVNIHYRAEGGTWTAVPGVTMANDPINPGYKKITIDIGTATRLEACFNNGSNVWDSNSQKNYFFNVGDNIYIPGINGVVGQVKIGEKPEGTDKIAPSVPANLAGNLSVGSPKTITLTWSASTDNIDVVGYQIIRKVGTNSETIDLDGTTFIDSTVTEGTTYKYQVRARDEANNFSGYSNEVTVVVPGGGDTIAPSQPTNVTGTATTSSVTIQWMPSMDNVGVVSYDIFNGSLLAGSVAGTATSYTITGLSPNTVYSFTVKAEDAAGNKSDPSLAFNVTTLENVFSGNLLLNPGFEAYTGSNGVADNWVDATSDGVTASFELVTTPVTSGSQAQQLTGTNLSIGSAAMVYQLIPVEANTSYTASGQFKINSLTDAIIQFYIDFYDASNAFVGYAVLNHSEVSDSYSPLQLSGITPDTAVSAKVYVILRGSGENGSGSFIVDDMKFSTDNPGDTQPPSIPADLVSNDVTDTTVSLSWAASEDNTGVEGYVIYRDGVQVGTSTITSFIDIGLNETTPYSYTVKAYDIAGNFSSESNEITVVTLQTPIFIPGGDKPYSTNPTLGKRVATPIMIDGVNNGEWTDDMLIAIDMAGDDPRTLGSNWSLHESPMDLSHLWAAWDNEYLYLAWQYVDVTDIVDPANAGSAGGTPIRSMDMPQTIAFDTISGAGASNDMWKKNANQPLWGGANLPDYQFNIASNMFHTGYISKAINGVFPVDDGSVNYKTGAAAGITVKFAKGKGYTTLWGVKDADDVNDPSKLVEYMMLGHDANRDTFYEAKIPLSALGNPDIEHVGIGVMLHQGEFSPMDTLPNDPSTSDTSGVSESNSPLEWADIDLLTVPFARIGR